MEDKISSLIKLLGDDDDVVVMCATRELKKMGVDLLEEWEILTSKTHDYKVLKKINNIIEDIQIDAIAKKVYDNFSRDEYNINTLFSTLSLIEKYCFIYSNYTPEEIVSDLETLMSINGMIWKFIESDSPLHVVALCHMYFVFKSKSHSGINPDEIRISADMASFISIFRCFRNEKLLKLLINQGQSLFLKTKRYADQIELHDFFLRNLTVKEGSIHYLLYYIFIQKFLSLLGYKKNAKIVTVQSVNRFLNVDFTAIDQKINKDFDYFLMIEEDGLHYLYDYKTHRYNKVKILSVQHNEEIKYDSKYVAQINAFEPELNFVLIEQQPKQLLASLIHQLNNLKHNSFNYKLLNRLNILFQNV